MNEKLIVLTDDNFFGQTRKPWVSLDTDKLVEIIQENGFEVQRYSFHEVANTLDTISDSIIFYSFSQKENLRKYIRDIISYLDNGSNILIPSFDLLKCHENKGYQELYKKKIGLQSLNGYYFSSLKELDGYELRFPLVLKTPEGSNAKGVFLVHDNVELEKMVKKLTPSPGIFTKVDLFRRKYFRGKKKYKEYPNYSNRKDYYEYRDYVIPQKRFVLQPYIPNLDFDYRVLTLYDKYYITLRHTHEGDFRASGTKKFDFDFQLDPAVLDYAKSIYETFDTPFLSMDILHDEENFYLSEYQALHFGINVFVKSDGYYQYNSDQWKFVEKKPDIELEMATGLCKYTRKKLK
jgi:glutathione synthase/RimK-type ligase-like ATP-grasp enzyme